MNLLCKKFIKYIVKKLHDNISTIDFDDFKLLEEGKTDLKSRINILNLYIDNLEMNDIKKEDTINILKSILIDIYLLTVSNM